MTGIVNLQLINDINMLQILEPVCSESLPTPKDIGTARRYLIDLSESLLSSAPNGPAYWCRVSLFLLEFYRVQTDVYNTPLIITSHTNHKWGGDCERIVYSFFSSVD